MGFASYLNAARCAGAELCPKPVSTVFLAPCAGPWGRHGPDTHSSLLWAEISGSLHSELSPVMETDGDTRGPSVSWQNKTFLCFDLS